MESLERVTAERIRELLRIVSACLSDTERADVERMIWAGEPVVAFECLCGTLAARGVSVNSIVLEEIGRLGHDLGADMTFCDGILEA